MVSVNLGVSIGSTSEGIDNLHIGLREIDAVARSDGEAMNNRRRCDEAVFNRHTFAGFAKTRQQFRPFQSTVDIPGKTVETPGSCIEPAFQRCPLLSFGKDKNI